MTTTTSENQKKRNAKILLAKTHELQLIRKKMEGVTADDIDTVRKQFEQRLKADGISRMEWLRQRGMESDEPTVSKVLNGKAMSARVLDAILDYLIKT